MKKKIWSVMLAFSLLVAELQAPIFAYADEKIILGDPEDPDSPITFISGNSQVDAGDTIYLVEDLPEIQRSNAGFQEPVSGIYANKIDKAIDISMNKTTYFAAANWTYCAETPNLVSFLIIMDT